MRRWLAIAMGMTAVLWLPACGPRKPSITKKELIARELERRKQLWEAGWVERCWEEVYAEASRRADSVIIERVRHEQLLLRGFQRKLPPPPPRVDFPEDSLPLAPLLRDTAWLDSLLGLDSLFFQTDTVQ